MKPIEFEGQNVIMQPPPGFNQPGKDLKCGILPVMQAEVQGTTSHSSFWKPDAADLAVLNAGGHVRLDVFGRGHPPVWVSIEKVKEMP